MEISDQTTQVWPIVAYFIVLAGMLIVMMPLSYFLGPKSNQRAKNTPYESGIISVSNNKTRFTNHFFLYAIFFVIFDLEAIYLFAWVIAFDEVGWPSFCEEACPTYAIQLTPDVELAEYDRQNLIYEKEHLLINGPGKYHDYSFYQQSGIAIAGKNKGQAEQERLPIDIKGLMP